MQTVRDGDGTRYLLLKRSGGSSLVRDPDSGEERYLENDELSAIEGVSALETAAEAVDEPVRRLVSAVHDDRTLGLVLLLDTAGPLAVRELLGIDAVCESDLHGTLAELRAAGLIEEREVAGERGYGTTDRAGEALASLRGE
jgi:hypothetical protein